MFHSTKIQCLIKAFYLVLIVTGASAAAELTIFDVRRSLPMSDAEKPIRDFYINGGSEAGLNVGLVITVQRRVPLYDTYSNRSAGDLDLKVGRVKIIHVQKGLAVARLQNEFDYSSAPLLEDNFIMVGDRLNLATAVNEGSSKKAGAEAETEEEQASMIVPSGTTIAGKIIVNTTELSSQVEPVQAPILQ